MSVPPSSARSTSSSRSSRREAAAASAAASSSAEAAKSPRRRRQLGAERRTEPLPVVHPRPSLRRIVLSRLAILTTGLAWIGYVVSTVLWQFLEYGSQNFRFTMETVGYLLVVTMLTFSALMYLVARHGALLRFRAHRRTSRAELDAHFSGHSAVSQRSENDAPMVVLVPSYAEEPGVVRQTLWSAALQEYPEIHVVLLIDDAPDSQSPALEQTRSLSAEIEAALKKPGTRMSDAQVVYEMGLAQGQHVNSLQVLTLAGHYSWGGSWLRQMASQESRADHVDDFFCDQVLGSLATELEATADALVMAAKSQELPAPERMLQLHRRLAWIFTAKLSSFERKSYTNLSHEANKAMNLNAYLGLLGGEYRAELSFAGTALRPVQPGETPDLSVPDAEFVLTLDADSLLLPEYCLRLVHLLEQPGNERIAVTQTPYSSFRGAGSRIERLAGATTDIQHLLHQGMSHAGATFWVGANAVIRTAALQDIAETSWENGVLVKRFVQDRTVIEDTESSIDLGTHGWTLMNYPERLSYSATPPDFGSLVVQRRRWANGGLLILPKLARELRARRRRGEQIRLTEVLLRLNYMASIAWASLGLIFLLAYPYDSRLLSPLILLAAVPYFLTMGADLRECGYKFSDIFRIYGFNLILLPVNLAGVIKSLQQALTGEKIPFARTPKVKDRTAAPWLYALAPVLIVAFSLLTLWRDIGQQNWGNAAFAAFNAFWGAWAFIAYIGAVNALVDVALAIRGWFYVEQPKASKRTRGGRRKAGSNEPQEETLDWRAVLDEGTLGASSGSRQGAASGHRAPASRGRASLGPTLRGTTQQATAQKATAPRGTAPKGAAKSGAAGRTAAGKEAASIALAPRGFPVAASPAVLHPLTSHKLTFQPLSVATPPADDPRSAQEAKA
ncbi:glycosyltransferase family 2 protein [Nesterenkonia sandarakina]|uniref:Cellulose synthase/poly-beta-1,6-N-acetylglucosamine synthase-like glycosyltransferase n=1 Tax=Nesterenkonia sandarakina TaxID=272918 RepID=A0A7Z0E8W3_9MICC|nr:glycosyltransferase family 2 protein [Nesterenkonia sandarakina]NYJ17116.1 cellulose synthase/poly-beta-1,6-N-acetylglucosamine synthase-like glycosyltransferase [Nesterenkonia sandarakina]